MTFALLSPRPLASAPAPAQRGFDDPRRGVIFVALAFLLLSKPQAIDFLRLLPFAALLVVVGLHLAARSGRPLASLRIPTAAVLLVVWLGFTAFWSDGTGISIVQTTSTLLVVLTASLIGSFCSLGTIVRGVVLGGLVVLALSVVLAAVAPATGLMPAGYQGGALRGLYVHRNLLAEVLSPAYVAALCLDLRGRHALLRHLGTAGILLGGVLLTRSSTALAAIGVATMLWVVLVPVRHARQLRATTLVVVLAASLAAAGVALANADTVFGLLQRDSTFTGRAVIWPAVQHLIAERPVEGYGWGATWDPSNYVYQSVSAAAKFAVPSAHNGYLDAWVQAGIVGLAGFVLVLVLVLARGVRELLTTRSPLGAWGVLLVLSVAVYNIGEASLVSFLQILLLIMSLVVLRRGGAGTPAASASGNA